MISCDIFSSNISNICYTEMSMEYQFLPTSFSDSSTLQQIAEQFTSITYRCTFNHERIQDTRDL